MYKRRLASLIVIAAALSAPQARAQAPGGPPPKVTVAGVPARIVGEAGCAEPARSMDQILAGKLPV